MSKCFTLNKVTTKTALQIRYAGPPFCCYIGEPHFCNYFRNYEFLLKMYKICSLLYFSNASD